MKFVFLALAAFTLVSAAPLPAPAPALPPATIRITHYALRITQQPTPPAFTITGTVEGQHRGGYSVPLGVYTAYGSTLAEANQHAEQLEQQIRVQATAQAVRP